MTQPIMHVLNPALKDRMPVSMEKEYMTVGWGLPPEHTKMSVIMAQKDKGHVYEQPAPQLLTRLEKKQLSGV